MTSPTEKDMEEAREVITAAFAEDETATLDTSFQRRIATALAGRTEECAPARDALKPLLTKIEAAHWDASDPDCEVSIAVSASEAKAIRTALKGGDGWRDMARAIELVEGVKLIDTTSDHPHAFQCGFACAKEAILGTLRGNAPQGESNEG